MVEVVSADGRRDAPRRSGAVTFQPDGLLLSEPRDVLATFRYEVAGDKLRVSVEGRSRLVPFKVSGDDLTLKDPDTGERMRFRRVPAYD